MQQLEYIVPTISCGHCKKAIETALGGVAGVVSVEVTVPEKKVAVSYDAAQVTPEQIREALDDEGFTPQ